MKKLVFLTVFFIIVGAFCVHILMNKHNVTDTTTQPHPKAEHTLQIKSNQSVPKTEASIVSDKLENKGVNTERITVDADEPETEQNQAKQNDDLPSLMNEQTDPLTDYVEQAKRSGTWIGDPEEMAPDELHNAIYNQLLERFGDIPAVHTMMEYNRKWEKNMPMTIDEKIKGLEATLAIFPSESTRKTLAYYKWWHSKGLTPDMSSADMEHLRSLGISVEENVTEDNHRIRISTK